ncbi:MAG: hypothetical protein ACFE0Q_14625 [Anaerolineae bacterium]
MHIASGVYQHYDHGIDQGIRERWQYQRVNDGYHMHISFEADYTLHADVTLDKNNRIQQFDYRLDEHMHGRYRIADEQLHVYRTLPGNTLLEDQVPWAKDAVLDLPFLSCKGHTILHLAQYSVAPTFAPLLRSGDRAGDLAKQSVRDLGEERLTINDVVYATWRYQYRHDYWLDKRGQVVRVQNGQYEMILLEYQR